MKRFNITYRDGGYYVDTPNYEGDEVVDSFSYDAVVSALKEAVLQLEYMQTKFPTASSEAIITRSKILLCIYNEKIN